MKAKKSSDLLTIPGVGNAVAKALNQAGIYRRDDLKGRDPGELYDQLAGYYASKLDRCMLYVLRCAVYFVNEPDPDPDKLKWWYWKD